MRRLLALAFVLTAVPASAQRIEFSPVLYGYSTSGDIDSTSNPGERFVVESGPIWGAQFGYLFTSHVEVEAVWTRRTSDVTSDTSPIGTATLTLFPLTTNEVTGNVVYRFQLRPNRVQPFIFTGAGVTRMASTDLDSASKLAWTLGGGVTWFLVKHVGIRFDGRYSLLELSTTDKPACEPITLCQDAVNTLRYTAGMALRF